MSLSCDCGWGDGDYDWYFWPADDYEELSTKRRRRCRSCGELIALGALCLRFTRTREPRTEVELRMYAENDFEAIALADWYHCEACADQWFNLTELGFCMQPDDDMRENLREYQN